MTIGILSLQGDFERHRKMIVSLDVKAVMVRDPAALSSVDALIIPGGESTTMGKLLNAFDMARTLETRILDDKMPVFGTCAGMILLATEISGYAQYSAKALDITVERNAYGRQTESFETDVAVNIPGAEKNHTVRGVFIRAPRITRTGNEVEVLARHENSPVLVRQGNILAASFHPELTSNLFLHEYFCKTVKSVIKDRL